MSMKLGYYLGPYVKCEPENVYDNHQEQVFNSIGDALWELRGELGTKHAYYYGPNIHREGYPSREMMLDEVDSVQNLCNGEQVKEISWFIDAFQDEICTLREIFGKVQVCWGLVPGIH